MPLGATCPVASWMVLVHSTGWVVHRGLVELVPVWVSEDSFPVRFFSIVSINPLREVGSHAALEHVIAGPVQKLFKRNPFSMLRAQGTRQEQDWRHWIWNKHWHHEKGLTQTEWICAGKILHAVCSCAPPSSANDLQTRLTLELLLDQWFCHGKISPPS